MTARRRHQMTETEAIARALDRAARRWPGESRSQLLLRLVHVGGDVLSSEEARRMAVRASSGAYSDAFPSGYLADLRDDWPA